MKILCFGDSNTYGYCAKGGRIEENYPRLRESEYCTTINEGVCGRTTHCLQSFIKAIQQPHDLTILMLGTNDLSAVGVYSLERIIKQLEELIIHEKKKILLRKNIQENYLNNLNWPKNIKLVGSQSFTP